METNLIFYEKSGDIILGEIVEKSPNQIEVKILYPYYGISLTAKPKMCMLFSDNTYKTLGLKILEKCFYIGKIISRRKKEIHEDFLELEEELQKVENSSISNKKEQKQLLMEYFRIHYLNGFQSIPELFIKPLDDLYVYLKEFIHSHPSAQVIHPETENSNHSEAILKKLQKIKESDFKFS